MIPFPIPWKLVGVAAGALAVGLLYWRLSAVTEQRDAAKLDAELANQVAAVNAATLETVKGGHRLAVAALERTAAEAEARGRQVTIIKETIAHEPVTSTCGPAVGVALRWLHERAASP